MWHFFEQQLGYPITVLGTDYLSRVNMSKIDVLILPDGNYGGIYSDRALDGLKDWVRAGGKLIALEGAMQFLANKKDFLLKTKNTDSTALKKTSRPLIPTCPCAATAPLTAKTRKIRPRAPSTACSSTIPTRWPSATATRIRRSCARH
ncbi:MAG: hypothetical protein WKG07_17645 [Hymenobacter sp.]